MVSTPSSTSRPHNTYDVFLSFRGEDTRYSFTDHLYKELVRAQLRTFRDNDEIQLGHELRPEIKDAIIESRASIVVLSENYASSKWCLDELSLILEQRRTCNHFVLPVFYRVYPSAVRKQGQSFFVEGSNWTVDTMARWKKALIEVASLTGKILSGCKTHETVFIKEVVEAVYNQLDVKQHSTPAILPRMETVNSQQDLNLQLSTPANLTGLETVCQQDLEQFSTPANLTGLETVCQQDWEQFSPPAHLTGLEMVKTQLDLTGLETQVEDINLWLKDDEQLNVIAICGMGGSGKTTLAQCVYNSHKQYFESSSFVEEIGKHYKHGLLEIQKQLLNDVLGGEEITISSVYEGTLKIVEILQMKKVLIVLDDIDDEDELSILLGTNTFLTQSKIIITTRLLNIDAWFGSISWRCLVYKLKSLNDNESLELLSYHAFGSKVPLEGFEELAEQLVQYCRGNPLALKVLGSSLFVSDNDPRERNNMIEIWRRRINSLKGGDLDWNIQGVLQKSFYSLPLDSQRQLFLDIACFFVGESKHMVKVLRDDLHAKSEIRTLVNRCLLNVVTGKLMMHQLLQDMGRKIVSEESEEPSKRSRVWRDDESYSLLKKGDGSNAIEFLALDMRKVKQGIGSKPVALKTSSLAKMNKLKMLQLKFVTLTGSYKNFPMLRWLCWHGCPLKTMRPGLLQSSLVAVDMSYGHIEIFEAPTVLNSLKILRLEGCEKLISIRRLHLLPKLETLILSNCSSLIHLSESIEDLKGLVVLDLKGCVNLLKFSSKNVKPKHSWIDRGNSEQSLFSLPSSLKCLYLDFCKIKHDNDLHVAFHAQSLFRLWLGCNKFEFLPNSIDLKMLKTLDLYSCLLLKSLPSIPSTLEELYVERCNSLERITFQSGRYSLQWFSYEGCSKLCEVQGLFKLIPIAKIDEADLVQDMRWIKAFQDHKVDLVGDEITKGRDQQIQMLYEYGITSTYLQGIKDPNMMRYEHVLPSPNVSFHVPLHQKEQRIQGLHVSCEYKTSGSNDKDMWTFFMKISNKTKALTWVYNPLVCCKPGVDEDVVWLSYWPIGNTFDAGDEVHVDIIMDEQVFIVSECGVSLVYMDDGEENYENNTMTKDEEVIGGDLSEFKVATGGYYLCRRDLFGSKTSTRLKGLFGDDVYYPESQGWRKHRPYSNRSWELQYHIVVVLTGININSKSEINKIAEAVSSLVGVESVSINSHRNTEKPDKATLLVVGYVYPVEVEACVKEFDTTAFISSADLY